jgi:hypothetical protein
LILGLIWELTWAIGNPKNLESQSRKRQMSGSIFNFTQAFTQGGASLRFQIGRMDPHLGALSLLVHSEE